MHPFGRASPSVINRLIKAGSLLSPTCSSGDIRAIPSISQAATPMKPRANLRNRTRQPKGCANRIAKPARQCRTSQNHLMMIILNKTGATTVAQLDFETLAIHTQSETRGCRRHVLCANFSKTRALFLLLSHRPQRKGRAGAPHGGVGACRRGLLWLCFGVSCGICASAIVLTSRLSCLVMHGRRGRGRGRRGSRLCGLWTCRRRVVATRRRTLVFTTFLVVSYVSTCATLMLRV